MKKITKIFIWVLFLAFVFTLTQAETFEGIIAYEVAFLTSVSSDLFSWFGTVILWKWVFTSISILGLLVIAIVKFTKVLFGRPRKVKSPRKRKQSTIDTHQVKTENEIRMSTPGKFARIIPKDSNKK